jgi:anaerobic selenocysteine-containing dehydrogenase
MHELDRLCGPDPPRSIVIDPRETESAREAKVHLAIRPGTNLAVLNGLARELIENDRLDRAFLGLHTVGFEDLERTVSAYTPERFLRSAASPPMTCGVRPSLSARRNGC